MRRLGYPITLAALLITAAAPSSDAVTPGTRHAATPASLNLVVEDVRFETHDEVTLGGWWFAGPAKAPVVVLASRGTGTMADLLPAASEFHRRGFSVLTFDYRDFGPGSTGHDTLKYVIFASRWVDDMLGALAYARTRTGDTTHVFAWGQDLGSAVALAAAARDRRACDALAIEGVFRTTQEALRANGTAVIPDVPDQHRRMVLQTDEPMSACTRLLVPLFVIMAGQDEVTPPAITQQATLRSLSRVDRWTIPQAKHDGTEGTPGYYDRLARWYKSWQWVPVTKPAG
jgi:pimeloyl-ACP methyl ester carboxylesterase